MLLHNPRGEQAACVPRDGREPIGEIAYAVCFRSLAYFSSSSKERYGVTPSTYRREPPGDA